LKMSVLKKRAHTFMIFNFDFYNKNKMK
jgi:hypothetical protein